MERKKKFSMIHILALLALLMMPTAAIAQTGSSDMCEQDYTVQAGDSLSLIAGQLLGNTRAFPAIVDATNAAAQSGDYTAIDNPDIIAAGWTLCIPASDDVQTTTVSPTTTSPTTSMTLLASSNPGDLANDMVASVSADLSSIQASYSNFGDITSVESVKQASDGTTYLTVDLADSTGGIVIADSALQASGMIAGANTGLMAPKGLEVVDDLGLIVVADFGAKDIKVFSSDATGNASPLFTVTDLGGERSLWDIHHDLASDTLFAAGTDGAFLVYNNFSASQGSNGPDQVITPVDDTGSKVSVNLHGIYYVPGSDTLLLSDVGDAASASDGQLFTINNVSAAVDTAPVAASVGGANTALGNPVDIDFDGSNLYVAEKSNDVVLRFDNILSWTGSYNTAADQSIAVAKAESVNLISDSTVAMNDSMMGGMMMAGAPLVLASSNPGEITADAIVGLPLNLSAAQATFGDFSNINSVQSVKVAADGTAYVTFDGPDSTGGIMIVDGFLSGDAAIGSGSRMIAGENTGLIAPKGLDVVDDLGLILVADFGAKDIKVFDATATGDVAPLFTVANLGGERSIWDVDHDLASDTLFAAGTDGAYLIYNQFSAMQGKAGPNQVVTPIDNLGGKVSVNLHGIEYVADADILLLTDVGDAGSASDGQIFTIGNAAGAMNTAPIRLQINGSNTALGNPVDLVFDGNNLYVAEKSNDAVLRYDNILTRTGYENSAADQAMSVTKAESLAIVR